MSANLQENQAELSQARAEAQHARLELDLAGERVSTSAALAQEAQSGLQAAQAESARVQVDLTVAQVGLRSIARQNGSTVGLWCLTAFDWV